MKKISKTSTQTSWEQDLSNQTEECQKETISMWNSCFDKIDELFKDGKIDKKTYQELKMKQQKVVYELLNDWSSIFKQAYAENDLKECIRVIFKMLKPDGTGLVDRLYRNENLIKNPLSYKFTEEDFNKISKIIGTIFKILRNRNDDFVKDYGKEFVDNFSADILQLHFLYGILYPNHVLNEKRISEHRPFKTQSLALSLKQLLIFLQDQSRLMFKDVFSKQKQISDNGGYITGNEIYVSKKINETQNSPKESYVDNFEFLITATDNLIRFLYYNHSQDFKTNKEYSQVKDATPYEIPNFENMLNLGMTDVLYQSVESRFRYASWQFFKGKNPENITMYAIKAIDVKARMVDLVAGFRRNHAYWLASSYWANKIYGIRNINPCALENQSICQLEEYIDISKRLDINNPENFHFINQQEYNDISIYADIPIESAKRFIKPYYFNCMFDGINIDDIFKAFKFLYTYSKIYLTASLSVFNETDKTTYDYLIPSISINYLYKEFATISSNSMEKSIKLINCFIFNPDTAKNKELGDLFTRPLVQINDKQVLLCEILVGQTNLMRSVETILTAHKVNLAPVGKDFEKNLISKLSKGKKIQVNTNHIEFQAFDGKMAEFDCIAVFDDYLLLIEAKSVLTPYDFDEYAKRKDYLKCGVEQVKRRCLVVQKNWQELKEQVNISLPNSPFSEDKIIKIVCTDILNFTGLLIDGVTIIDEQSLIKYFTDPYISEVKGEGPIISSKKQRVLWGTSNEPSIKEFKDYIKEPLALSHILKSMEEEERPIPVFDANDKPIVIIDYGLKEDPWNKTNFMGASLC